MSTDVGMDEVESAIGPVRESLRLDGADVTITRVEAGTVELALDVAGASCQECVLPQDILEQTLLLAIRKALPAITAVTVLDPRVDQAATPAEG